LADDEGPVKQIDNLCFDRVVRMMSLDDAARKKMFDNMLNHWEF